MAYELYFPKKEKSFWIRISRMIISNKLFSKEKPIGKIGKFLVYKDTDRREIYYIITNGNNTVTNVVEAPAKLVNKGYKKLGVTSPVLNNSIGLWNRGVHGYQTGLEGIRQGLNAISPGTQSFNDSGNVTHSETLFHTPTFKKGGQNNNWLNKYK